MNTADLLRSQRGPEPAPEGTVATLIIGFSSTTCSHCRQGAFPHQATHEDLAGSRVDAPGCGATFTAIAADRRLDDHWRMALTEMRPDLPIVDYVQMMRGETR